MLVGCDRSTAGAELWLDEVALAGTLAIAGPRPVDGIKALLLARPSAVVPLSLTAADAAVAATAAAEAAAEAEAEEGGSRSITCGMLHAHAKDTCHSTSSIQQQRS